MKKLLRVQGVSRRYGSLQALAPTTFDLYEGELLTFVGPSGAGKSSLLRILAGIDSPDSGSVRTDRPFDRDHPAILVFQDYLLFPHLTVFENVAFGLRARRRKRRMSRAEIRERVLRYLHQLGVRDKADFRPAALSGGQRQRVALARALVMEPRLLLLDEPFANLDKALKRSTAQFIGCLQRDLAVTTVLVSHDLEEAVEIADRVGVIVNGTLEQIGVFREVYEKPRNLEVAEMFGPINRIPVNVYYMLTRNHDTTLPRIHEGADPACRPEALFITPSAAGPASVTGFRLRSGVLQYEIEIDGWHALASARTNDLSIGDRVSLELETVLSIPEPNKGGFS